MLSYPEEGQLPGVFKRFSMFARVCQHLHDSNLELSAQNEPVFANVGSYFNVCVLNKINSLLTYNSKCEASFSVTAVIIN